MEDQNVVMSEPTLFSGKKYPVALFLLTALLSFVALRAMDGVFPPNSIHPATILGFSASFVLGLVLHFVIGIIPGFVDGKRWWLWAAAPLYYPTLRIWIDTAIDPTSHNLWPFEIIILSFYAALVLLGALFGGFLRKKIKGNNDPVSTDSMSLVSKVIFRAMIASVLVAFAISMVSSLVYHPPAILGPGGPLRDFSKPVSNPENTVQNSEFSGPLMDASNKGLLPRRLSNQEADTLARQIAIVSDQEYRQGYTGEQLKPELDRLDAMSRSLTGLSWDQLLAVILPSGS